MGNPIQGRPLRLVGLLGGVASGKTTVAAEFARLGAAVVDADRFAREALGEPEVLREIRGRFGPEVFAADGSADRKRLAARVFGDPELRRALERIVHPRVRRRIEEALDALRCAGGPALAILDVPLLAEGGLLERCDATVFVEAPEALRRRRAKEGRGWPEAELELRERCQASLEQKRRMADYVVANGGSVDDLRREVEETFRKIMSKD